jgi:hypothetical protein
MPPAAKSSRILQRHPALQESTRCLEDSPAKAQRRKALPRFCRFSLRLCAFAGEFLYTCGQIRLFVQSCVIN